MPIIRVALDVPVNTLFDYIAPSATTQHIGVRVQVPFGKKMVIGVIIEVTTDSSFSKGKLRSAKYIFNDIELCFTIDSFFVLFVDMVCV